MRQWREIATVLKNTTDETLECMEKQTNKIASVLNFVGGVSGVIALGTLVFYGGALAEQVRGLNVRVSVLESNGSVQVREHIVMDDERLNGVKERLNRLESVILTVPAELSRINVKLDLMKEKLDKVP